MNRKCANIRCQKPITRKRYPCGAIEPEAVFLRRKHCDNRCAAVARHAKPEPTSMMNTQQVERQIYLNNWPVV